MKNRIFGLPRNIVLLGLTSLFNDFSSEMIYAVFPAFFTTVLKAGAGSLGAVDGIAEFASNIFKIYSGYLSDRLQSRKTLVVAGYTLSVLTRPAYALVFTVTGALGLRFLDRVGKGLRDSARDSIISLSASEREIGRAFGFHRAMDTVGAILGPLAAYLILSRFPSHFPVVFFTAFAVGLLAIASLIFIRDVAVRARTGPRRLIASFGRFSPGFKLYLGAILVLSMGSLPVAVILLKTESLGLVIADIPLFYMIYNLSYAAFSMAAGKASDRKGARAVILAGYAVLLVSYLLLGIARSIWSLVLGFLVLGLFPALTDGVQRALAAQLTSADQRGSGLGLLNAANGVGALIAGAGGGYIWQVYGAPTAFLAASAILVVGLILLLVSSRAGGVPHPHREPEQAR
jgi:MFS family permease